MPSYQYRKSHCGDKTVVKSSYLHNGISYTGKTVSLYWIRALLLACIVRWTLSMMLLFVVQISSQYTIWYFIVRRSWSSQVMNHVAVASLPMFHVVQIWKHKWQQTGRQMVQTYLPNTIESAFPDITLQTIISRSNRLRSKSGKFKRLFRYRSKKTSKPHVTGHCEGN